MLDVSHKRLVLTSQDIRKVDGKVDYFLCDVTSEEQVADVFNKIRKSGSINIVVNNAGIVPKESYAMANVPIELWDNVMDINVKGYFLITKYAEKAFISQAEEREDKKYISGSLIYICSNAGIFGSKKNIYGISNAARICIMRQAALEMGTYGIRSNAIIPGDILEGSGIWDNKYLAQRAKAKGISISETKKYYEERATLGKKATVEQVAKIAAALVSPIGPFENTTGQIIRCDGGQIMM